MRIAVCFSGLIRTGLNCTDNIKRFLGDMLPYCDFFMHTWDYETQKPFARTHWNDIPFLQRPDEVCSERKINDFINAYKVVSYKVDSYSDFIKNNLKDKLPIVWYTMSRSFELKKQYEQDNNFTYDVVIKIRPDVIFPSKKRLKEELQNINLSKPVIYSDPHDDFRLDDVFWITNSSVADVAIGIANLQIHYKYVNPGIVEFLQKNGITHKPLSKSKLVCYTIYRYESYMYDPMTDFRGCYINDLIHYSSTSEEQIKQVINSNDKNNSW